MQAWTLARCPRKSAPDPPPAWNNERRDEILILPFISCRHVRQLFFVHAASKLVRVQDFDPFAIRNASVNIQFFRNLRFHFLILFSVDLNLVSLFFDQSLFGELFHRPVDTFQAKSGLIRKTLLSFPDP